MNHVRRCEYHLFPQLIFRLYVCLNIGRFVKLHTSLTVNYSINVGVGLDVGQFVSYDFLAARWQEMKADEVYWQKAHDIGHGNLRVRASNHAHPEIHARLVDLLFCDGAEELGITSVAYDGCHEAFGSPMRKGASHAQQASGGPP